MSDRESELRGLIQFCDDATADRVRLWRIELNELIKKKGTEGQMIESLLRIANACDEVSEVLAHLSKALRRDVDELETRNRRDSQDS